MLPVYNGKYRLPYIKKKSKLVANIQTVIDIFEDTIETSSVLSV